MLDDFTLSLTNRLLGDERPANLTRELHGSWISFATTGDPAVAGRPEYEPGSRYTMVFDEKTAVVSDPEGERRACWDHVPLDG
ncbi:hypothetical protein GCM10022222_15140 [Amycolatopsis ultiminotia]|uniref:Lipocalin-like domain-containing protein n=1 Tax=Amycolatopsis ultiminotia TaxID=543629 RepID=A0ABP6VBS9_9PSEU